MVSPLLQKLGNRRFVPLIVSKNTTYKRLLVIVSQILLFVTLACNMVERVRHRFKEVLGLHYSLFLLSFASSLCHSRSLKSTNKQNTCLDKMLYLNGFVQQALKVLA